MRTFPSSYFCALAALAGQHASPLGRALVKPAELFGFVAAPAQTMASTGHCLDLPGWLWLTIGHRHQPAEPVVMSAWTGGAELARLSACSGTPLRALSTCASNCFKYLPGASGIAARVSNAEPAASQGQMGSRLLMSQHARA